FVLDKESEAEGNSYVYLSRSFGNSFYPSPLVKTLPPPSLLFFTADKNRIFSIQSALPCAGSPGLCRQSFGAPTLFSLSYHHQAGKARGYNPINGPPPLFAATARKLKLNPKAIIPSSADSCILIPENFLPN